MGTNVPMFPLIFDLTYRLYVGAPDIVEVSLGSSETKLLHCPVPEHKLYQKTMLVMFCTFNIEPTRTVSVEQSEALSEHHFATLYPLETLNQAVF